MCSGVDKIDEYHVSELTVDKFQQIYADSDRPVVIRNATLDWPAMEKLNFGWLREAYLSDPEILDYENEKECWYNNYKSPHLPPLSFQVRHTSQVTLTVLTPTECRWSK